MKKLYLLFILAMAFLCNIKAAEELEADTEILKCNVAERALIQHSIETCRGEIREAKTQIGQCDVKIRGIIQDTDITTKKLQEITQKLVRPKALLRERLVEANEEFQRRTEGIINELCKKKRSITTKTNPKRRIRNCNNVTKRTNTKDFARKRR